MDTSLLALLAARFEQNMQRHAAIAWPDVAARLAAAPAVLASVGRMEDTGGAPDVVVLDAQVLFCDCSPETPAGRRSLCYDGAARAARKENQPAGSAVEMADEMGVRLLTEAQYHALQALGEFDLRTSSWILTPPDLRALGGALFCDRRYGRVFTYHNGPQSYYAGRGFRGVVPL